ncbi:MAG: (2Fe-2S)-binding protein [Candidatus Tectomicrobia bacterium]|nr:(2Fe-2S)-binding protein [Candidatus Tectomicrobia bacterium]
MELKKLPLELRINGELMQTFAYPHLTLLEVVREHFGLTGSKRSCDFGECGACTMLVDGVPHLSCITIARSVRGKEITTIEGLAWEGTLHPVQQAFVSLGGIQCGFCTPGFIMTAKALLDRNPEASEEEIRHALAGNLCRCTGYVKILDAVLSAAKEVQAAGAQAAVS